MKYATRSPGARELLDPIPSTLRDPSVSCALEGIDDADPEVPTTRLPYLAKIRSDERTC